MVTLYFFLETNTKKSPILEGVLGKFTQQAANAGDNNNTSGIDHNNGQSALLFSMKLIF